MPGPCSRKQPSGSKCASRPVAYVMSQTSVSSWRVAPSLAAASTLMWSPISTIVSVGISRNGGGVARWPLWLEPAGHALREWVSMAGHRTGCLCQHDFSYESGVVFDSRFSCDAISGSILWGAAVGISKSPPPWGLHRDDISRLERVIGDFIGHDFFLRGAGIQDITAGGSVVTSLHASRWKFGVVTE